MTNADKIRSMTDEQLAEWIMRYVDPCALCAFRKRGSCGAPQNKGCGMGRLEWVKREIKENNNEL